MKKLFFLLFFFSLLQFDLTGQDWNVKTQGDSVLVQQGKKWVHVTSKGITDNLLKQTENLMKAKDELVAAKEKVKNLEGQIVDFKKLKILIEQKEASIARNSLAATKPKSKKKKKGN